MSVTSSSFSPAAMPDAPSRPTAADPRSGTLAGGYTLGARVARSPHATVYRARRADEDAALKIYDARLLATDWSERWERERIAQDRVNHRSVARVLDAGLLADGSAFIASQWINGRHLASRLAEKPMNWSEARPILAAVGAGLGAIHAAGVVHRDIKPANVMLVESGQPAAVILDFGHSLVLGEKRLTTDGLVLGSAAYMAPEQAAGESLDARADFYSLGVVLYQILTGHLPFEHVSPAEVLTQHRVAPVVPPRKRAPERNIPGAAEDLCLWLLAKDPNARLPNARVLAVTLASLGEMA